MDELVMARKIRVETNLRCDYDGGIIPKGKYATQVIGDPEQIKAQGTYHGKPCYDAALAHYQEETKMNKIKEEAQNGE